MSDLLRNFSQNMLQQRGGLTQIGAGISQIVQQKRAEEAKRLEIQNFQTARDAFGSDQSGDNLLAMYEASPALFEPFKKAWESKSELETKYALERNGQILSGFASGNPQMSFDRIIDYAAALKKDAAENPMDQNLAARAQQWNKFKTLAEKNDANSLNEIFMITTGVTPEGQAMITSILNTKANRRAEQKATTDFIESGVGIEYTSDAHKNRVLTGANKMEDSALARLYAEMGSVIGGEEGGGMDSNQIANFALKLNNEYADRVSPYTKVADSAAKIEGLAKAGTGFGDQGMIMLFNKVLDPPSVVRESEARMTADNQGIVDRGRTLLASLKAGERLSDVARAELLEAVRIMSDLAVESEGIVQDKMNPLVDAYLGEKRRPQVYGPARGVKPVGEETASLTPEQKYLINKYPDERELILGNDTAFMEREYRNSLADFRAIGNETTDEETIKVGF